MSKSSQCWAIPVLQIFRHLGNLTKLNPNTRKSHVETPKKNPKSSESRPPVCQVTPAWQGFRYWSNSVKLGLDTPNQVQGETKNNLKSSALCFYQLKLYFYAKVIWGLCCTCFTGMDFVSYLVSLFASWTQIPPQIMCRPAQKVIQSFQLHISHQLRSYSSVKAFHGSSYTCFINIKVFGQYGPKYSKSCKVTHKK